MKLWPLLMLLLFSFGCTYVMPGDSTADSEGGSDLILASSLGAEGIETWTLDVYDVECGEVAKFLARSGVEARLGDEQEEKRVTLHVEGSPAQIAEQAGAACSGNHSSGSSGH